MNPLETVLQYHEQTKHRPNRYARSMGYLDWANQPDPFRRYAGAPTARLLLSEPAGPPAYDALFEPDAIDPQPVTHVSISEFLQYALGLSAWKEFGGSRWALRINPSSGNLHPTEGYLALGAVADLAEAPGVFHYAPKEHVLERRRTLAPADWDRLLDGFPPGTFLAGLTSIHWREAWKYGERAYRYCQHDVGHALAALALSAALQGWRVHPLTALGDEGIATLLGLEGNGGADRAEREHSDLLIAVIPVRGDLRGLPGGLAAEALVEVGRTPLMGEPNRLSSDHVAWDIIDAVAEACAMPADAHDAMAARDRGRLLRAGASSCGLVAYAPSSDRRSDAASARRIIQQRRSAVAMDGRTRLGADQFYGMMDRVLHRGDRAPWAALGYAPHVHLALMVHRVDGLEPGLYMLVRTPDALPELQQRLQGEFDWCIPKGCPEGLPLYHLVSGDARQVAGQVSCGQDIAADGAFSLGMLAKFERPLADLGPWLYRNLFWETGMIGQVLYLEAEAAGIRATGIGCFFDDLVHDLFGVKDRTWQSLYHFTVGGPVEDDRLTTLPAYG